MKPYHHQQIKTGKDFRETIRAGAYAWPGGYPLFFIAEDSGAICFDCAKKQARAIICSIRTEMRDGWRIVDCDVNYEDENLTCDHCGQFIESAYGEPATPKGN